MSSPVVSFQTFGLQGPAGLIDPMLYPKAMQVGSAVGAQQGTMLGNIAAGLGKGVEQGVGIANTVANIQQTQAETANLPTPEQARDLTNAEIALKQNQAAYYGSRAGDANSPAQQAANQNKANAELDKKILSDISSLASAGFGDQLANFAANPDTIQSALRNPDVAAQLTAAMQGAGLTNYQSYNNIAQIAENHQKNAANLKLMELNTALRTMGVEGLQKDSAAALVDLTPFVGQRENYASVGITSSNEADLENGKIKIKPTPSASDLSNGKGYFYDKNTNELLGEVPVNSTGDYIDWQKKLQTVRSFQASVAPILYKGGTGLEKPGVGTPATAFENLATDRQKQAVDAAIDADRANIPLSDTVQKQIQNLPPDAQLPAQRAAQKTAAIVQAPAPVKAKIAAIDTNPVLQGQPSVWKALAFVESGGNDQAESPTGVKGLFQVTEPTFNMLQKKYPTQLAGKTRENPEASLTAAKLYMAELNASFNADQTSSLAAYNGGPGVIKEAQKLAGSNDFNVYKDYLAEAIRKSSDPYYQSISNDPEKVQAKAREIQLYPIRFYEALKYF